jgi:DNA-binding FadR family transcriptional regulator
VWRPVRGGNAFEITVSRLVQAIKLGMVTAGERLPPERELAEKLRVSRVTLRQAIGALREAGYLESRRGRTGGTFVLYQGPADDRPDAATLAREMGETLHDALDFRRVLESGAAALVATRTLSACDRAHLVACLAASRERDPAVRRTGDSRLHLAIAAASRSGSVAQASADSSRRSRYCAATSITPTPSTPGSSRRSWPATRTERVRPWRSTAMRRRSSCAACSVNGSLLVLL